MNASSAITMNYEQLTMNYANKNKPNSKPIQSQYKPNSRNVQIDVNLVKTRNYNNEQRTMNYELLFKTNPNKPNLVRHSLGEGGFKPGAYAQDDGMVPSMYFAILGGRWRISVKWRIKIFSISLSVFSLASASSFKLLKQFAAVLVSLILSGKLSSQSLQTRPLAELLK